LDEILARHSVAQEKKVELFQVAGDETGLAVLDISNCSKAIVLKFENIIGLSNGF
jgi:hypothetical protein